MKYNVRVTKCYLVQVLDDEGNEVSCNYTFSHNKKEAEQIGALMVAWVQAQDEKKCKWGYCDCICNTERYQNICAICVDGSEYDDEDK